MQCTRSPTLQLHTKVYVQPSDLSCTVVVSERAKAHMWATHQASWTVSVIAKSSYRGEVAKLNGILTLVSDRTDIYIAVYIIMCVVIYYI